MQQIAVHIQFYLSYSMHLIHCSPLEGTHSLHLISSLHLTFSSMYRFLWISFYSLILCNSLYAYHCKHLMLYIPFYASHLMHLNLFINKVQFSSCYAFLSMHWSYCIPWYASHDMNIIRPLFSSQSMHLITSQLICEWPTYLRMQVYGPNLELCVYLLIRLTEKSPSYFIKFTILEIGCLVAPLAYYMAISWGIS
jgi:hypothetical protein